MGIYIKSINNTSKEKITYSEGLSFSELMNALYIQKSFKEGSTTYNRTKIEDVIYSIITDMDENIDIQCSSTVLEGEGNISILINDTSRNITQSYAITGIEEEVVSIRMVTFETEVIPSDIYFLTRKGNVYHTKNDKDIEHFSELVAEKIKGLSEVIALNLVDILDNDAFHGYTGVIATKYDGSYERL